jgi:hypothetical protein
MKFSFSRRALFLGSVFVISCTLAAQQSRIAKVTRPSLESKSYISRTLQQPFQETSR